MYTPARGLVVRNFSQRGECDGVLPAITWNGRRRWGRDFGKFRSTSLPSARDRVAAPLATRIRFLYLVRGRFWRRGWDSNPRMEVLQTSPLGLLGTAPKLRQYIGNRQTLSVSGAGCGDYLRCFLLRLRKTPACANFLRTCGSTCAYSAAARVQECAAAIYELACVRLRSLCGWRSYASARDRVSYPRFHRANRSEEVIQIRSAARRPAPRAGNVRIPLAA